MTSVPLLEIQDLGKTFTRKLDAAGHLAVRLGLARAPASVRAVDNVSLQIRRGEVYGLVGESGCGKSTLGRMIAGIIHPSHGSISYKGQPIDRLQPSELRERRLKMQMIFQDPYSSLNPRMRVKDIIGEAPQVHGLVEGPIDTFVSAQMERAGLDPTFQRRYPHQFSGGQRQRIGIARALAVSPEFLICDEAVAALDVSIQAQIINLFMDLRDQLGLTYLFISHDLGVVEHVADRVAIMYLGRVVEEASVDEIFSRAQHPYTRALLAEVPRLEARKRRFAALKGELPSPLDPPAGCHFHPRCPFAMPRCRVEAPALQTIAPGHTSACHLNDGDV